MKSLRIVKTILKKRINSVLSAAQRGVCISRVCRIFQISRSSYYNAQKETEKVLADEELILQIEEIQQKYAFTIGRRRMTSLLQRRFGVTVGECQTAVMRKFGLLAKIRQIRKARMTTRHAVKNGLPENILNRNFTCTEPCMLFAKRRFRKNRCELEACRVPIAIGLSCPFLTLECSIDSCISLFLYFVFCILCRASGVLF